MKRRHFIGAGFAAVTSIATTGCAESSTRPTPTVSIQSGKLQGEIIGGVHRFLGIPYAEPPYGERRWRSPARRQSWDGVLPATQYGAICPQTGGLTVGLPDEGEDCLNLNIWTPDPSANDLPVMVWLHGGGQVSGSGANTLYDGTHFAKEGVVLVTCNRRLGAEGYLYLEELFAKEVGPGNLGIQDAIAVLEWVRENIEQFGGNAGNVTLFGESGGGAATQAVIATPGVKGLVHHVIPQSGGHAAQRPDTATAIARHMINALGVKAGDLDALMRVPTHWFVEHYPTLQELDGLSTPQVYLPVINDHMPHHPVDGPYQGYGLDVDYLIGTCRDEANLFAALLPDLKDSTFHNRAQQVVAAAGVPFEDVISAFKVARPDLEPDDLFTTLLGDMWFRVPSIRIAEGHAAHAAANTYMYLFEWESPLLGAAHALDLMVFGNGLPFSILAGFKDYERTASFMRKAWVNFATTGDPSVPEQTWPLYDRARQTLSLNETVTVLNNPFASQFAVLQTAMTSNWTDIGL